jgi:hypothetical protein
MNMERIQLQPGQIEKVHAHLKAGHEVACITYTRCTIMDKPLHVDYIRADGTATALAGREREACIALPNTCF